MSKLRTLIEKGPELCGAKFSGRWSKSFLLQFDHEVGNPDSEFAAKDGEDPWDRLDTLDGLHMASDVYEEKVQYWIDLIGLAAHAYAVSKGCVGLEYVVTTLSEDLSIRESDYPEFAAILSVSEASILSNWA